MRPQFLTKAVNTTSADCVPQGGRAHITFGRKQMRKSAVFEPPNSWRGASALYRRALREHRNEGFVRKWVISIKSAVRLFRDRLDRKFARSQ
jgi:hypothetical protein